ncbi:MAG: hypothetical protein QOG40_1681, partial [Solirubrobacteraceae bacterium]|nr:hypothetical protein [Solirubrobacteraceae bacterium]
SIDVLRDGVWREVAREDGYCPAHVGSLNKKRDQRAIESTFTAAFDALASLEALFLNLIAGERTRSQQNGTTNGTTDGPETQTAP